MTTKVWLVVANDTGCIVGVFFHEQMAKKAAGEDPRYSVEEHESEDTPPGCIW